VNDVAGVIIVACEDVVMDAECDAEEGVEERGGVANPECDVEPSRDVPWDGVCGFRWIKGSLRPSGELAGEPVKGEPMAPD